MSMERSYSPCCSENTIIEAYPEFSLFPKHIELMSKIENEMGAKGSKDGSSGKLPEGENRGQSMPEGETRGQSMVGGGEAMESNREGRGQSLSRDLDIFVLNIGEEKGSSFTERKRIEGDEYLVQLDNDQRFQWDSDQRFQSDSDQRFQSDSDQRFQSDNDQSFHFGNKLKGDNKTDRLEISDLSEMVEQESQGTDVHRTICEEECSESFDYSDVGSLKKDPGDLRECQMPAVNSSTESHVSYLSSKPDCSGSKSNGSCSKPNDVFKDNNNHTDSLCSCRICIEKVDRDVISNKDTGSEANVIVDVGGSDHKCSACEQQNSTEKERNGEPMKCSHDEPLTSSDICSQCGDRATVLMFDEGFCEKCHRELELNMSEACSLDSSCSNPQTGSCSKEAGSGMIQDTGIGHLTVNNSDVTHSNGSVGYIQHPGSYESQDLKIGDKLCLGYRSESHGLSYHDKETPTNMGSIPNEINHQKELTCVDPFVNENVPGCEDFVDVFEDEMDKMDKTVEANTVIQTSDGVQWEGNLMCTCEECLKGLRIERIVTADKSTMCPDDPPYVLMCEICEE